MHIGELRGEAPFWVAQMADLVGELLRGLFSLRLALFSPVLVGYPPLPSFPLVCGSHVAVSELCCRTGAAAGHNVSHVADLVCLGVGMNLDIHGGHHDQDTRAHLVSVEGTEEDSHPSVVVDIRTLMVDILQELDLLELH